MPARYRRALQPLVEEAKPLLFRPCGRSFTRWVPFNESTGERFTGRSVAGRGDGRSQPAFAACRLPVLHCTMHAFPSHGGGPGKELGRSAFRLKACSLRFEFRCPLSDLQPKSIVLTCGLGSGSLWFRSRPHPSWLLSTTGLHRTGNEDFCSRSRLAINFTAGIWLYSEDHCCPVKLFLMYLNQLK